jgi:5-methyltetrahydropteroyltriglutamate--homocysteine methyltransferase
MANVFRADPVGGLVKPQALLQAEAAFRAGALNQSGLEAEQDAAILNAIALHKDLAYRVVTDGEFRRTDPDVPYATAISGVERRSPPPKDASDKRGWQGGYHVAGQLELRPNQRLLGAEARFLRAKTSLAFKISLFAPSSLALRMYEPGVTERVYPTLPALATAFAPIVQNEIEALAEDGTAYVQLNCPAYAWLYDASARSRISLSGQSLADAFAELLSIDFRMLGQLKKAPSLSVGLRISRCPLTNQALDTFERMLLEILPRAPVDRFLLEYAGPQPHDFQAIQALPADRIAVLGLVSSQSEPEDVGDIIARVDQAAAQTDVANLAVGPRTGFRNDPGLSIEAALSLQRRSLERAADVVFQVWGPEL